MRPSRLAGDRDRQREQRDSQHHHHRARPSRLPPPPGGPSRSSRPAQRRHLPITIHAPAGNSVQSRANKTRLNRRLPGARGGTSNTSAQIPQVIRFRTSSLAPANTPPSLLSSGTVGAFSMGPQRARLPARLETPSTWVPRSPRHNTQHEPSSIRNPRRSRRSVRERSRVPDAEPSARLSSRQSG